LEAYETMSKTIGLTPLKKFCRYILYTGYVKNAPRPVSGLIVASPERGKSTESQRFKGHGITTIQDTTSYGIDRYILSLTEEERSMFHHIVIPDLEKIGSRNRSVRDELLSKMRILMEEGLQRVCTGRDNLELKKPIVLGFLMCTTPEDIGDKRSVFRSLSFQSRCIPFTYEISDKLKEKILDFIEQEAHIEKQKTKFSRKEKAEVNLPTKYAEQLTEPAMTLARELERFSKKDPISKMQGSLIGIRIKENFMTLLKAIALYHGCKTVEKKHYLEFMRLFHWINYNFNAIDEDQI
jgi:hypothetical protein